MKKKRKYLNIDEIHAGLFEILSEFDRICRENGLRYSLAYGTLLGAIRHKGFIPWDDDVDVMMPRPDYEKFYSLVMGGEVKLKEHFLVSDDRGKKAPYPFMKMMDDRYSIKAYSHIEVPYLFVDIFPVDGVPDLPEKGRKKVFHKELFYNFVISMTKWYIFASSWWAYVVRVLCFWFYPIWMIYGRRRAIRKIHALLLKYPFETCELCDNRSWGMTRDYMPREIYDHFENVDFEGKSFSIISDWDKWLTSRYGDYMTPPPVKKRNPTHGMRIYRNDV